MEQSGILFTIITLLWKSKSLKHYHYFLGTTKGKKACPPEDCGGVWGYSDFLDAIKDPKNEEHKSMLEWVGREFDSDAFDMKLINRKLKELKL